MTIALTMESANLDSNLDTTVVNCVTLGQFLNFSIGFLICQMGKVGSQNLFYKLMAVVGWNELTYVTYLKEGLACFQALLSWVLITERCSLSLILPLLCREGTLRDRCGGGWAVDVYLVAIVWRPQPGPSVSHLLDVNKLRLRGAGLEDPHFSANCCSSILFPIASWDIWHWLLPWWKWGSQF